MKIAIIGAGATAAFLADRLCAEGHSLEIFEKSRGTGGRTACKRVTHGDTTLQYDYGAQYITAHNDAFKAKLNELCQSGSMIEWVSPNLKELSFDGSELQVKELKKYTSKQYFVGKPYQNSWIKELVQKSGAKLIANTLVEDLSKLTENFDKLILTCPPQQCADLLKTIDTDIETIKALEAFKMKASYAHMMSFDLKPKMFSQLDAALVSGNDQWAWLSLDNSKPSRQKDFACLIAHTHNGWTQDMIAKNPGISLDDVKPRLQEDMLDLVSQVFAIDKAELATKIIDSQSHRWLYAQKDPKIERIGTVPIRSKKVEICSAWLADDDIESAYLQAQALKV